ncbi:uncharacterized protein LOC119837690 [Zerene cesonia]|uniref:uncharacterized protein LOC119837690 n=1 Tax=Zerene cesonia TaxID=33412 RepID=UPI0018E5A5BC|nr:uncharacterized protein LOC119837690 [Zerene cesonia]
MTSTNDGKDVKSNQKSSQKGKTYYIELYKSLESRLSGDSTGEERTRCVGEAWRRVHSLCGHSAPSTHPHLLCWLQRHTARTVLQTEWPKSPDQHTILIDAIDAFLQDCSEAISKRNGESLDWESQLQQWAEGFKKILPNPWGHPVLQALLGGQVPSDEEILEWLKQERGVMLVTRLRQMVASKSCVDLALKLAATLRTRTRPPAPTHADGAPESAEAAQDTTEFAEVLRHEAGFTPDVWNFLMDIEFVLLDKVNNRPSCIELAKQIPFREACPLVERLNSRLESSPQEKKLWKNAKEVAVLIAQVVIARCMLVPVCRGDVLVALKGCFRSAVHMMGEEKLSTCSVGLAALATTARHLHTMAAAAHKQLKRERTPFVCQLYVRAITAGMNELEKLKLATEKEAEARSTEQTLSSWFTHLGSLLSASNRLRCECLLTAFSVHPSPTMYDMVKTAPHLEAIKDMQEPNLETTSEFGSWSTDSRTQTNLVKTSETLNIKHTQKQANVLSTAIFSEGEALGLEPELCNDLAVLLSGPRVKTLTWDMEREVLLENCRTYMERTHGGTKALTTELKYLNLDPSSFQHLPEEDDNEDDVYYGIEKGYEHLLEAQEPSPEYHPQLWQDPFLESPSISSDESLIVVRRRKKKKKRVYIEDPLKLDYETNSNKATERSTSIGESKSNSRDTTPHHSQSSQDADYKDTKPSIEAKESKKLKKEKKQGLKKEKKELKERKKREKSNIRSETQTDNQKVSGGLSRLLGMKVIRKTDEKDMVDMDNALKLQSIKNDEKMAKKTDQNKFMDNKSNRLNNISNESKSSGNSHENSSVVFDGLFSMDDMKFPDTQIILQDKTHNILSFNATNPPPLAPIKPDVKNSTSQNITNNKINEEVKKSVKRLIDFRRQKLQDQQVSDLLQCREEFPSESALLDSVSPKFVQVPDIPTAVISKPNKDFLNVPKPQTSNETNTRHNDKTRENNFIKQKTSKLSEKGVTESASQRAFEEFLKLQSYDAVNLLASPPLPQPVAKVDNVTQKKFEHLLNHNAKNQVSLLKTSKSKPQDLSQKKGPQKTTPKPSCNTDVPINKDVAPNPTQIPNTKSPSTMYDPTQKHFQNFLKELQQSINAGAFAKQNISSEKFTANKIFKQQKIADNAPNTFSRLSYLHKSKQMENKMKTEEEMRAKTDSNHLTTDLDKMLQLQSNGQIVISRVNKNQVKKPIDPMPVRSVKKPKPVSKIAQNHPHLINSLQAKSTIGNCNANQTLHNNLISQYSTKVETASTSTALSEKDQADLLLLLRQKSKLNAGYFAQNKTYFNDEFYSSCPTTNITDSSLKCQPDVQPHNTNLLQQPIHNSIVNVSKLIEASVTNQISGSRHDVTTSIPITNELKTNLTNTNTVIKTVNSVAPRYIQFKVLQKDEQEVYEINNDMNLKESCNFRDSLPKKEINEHASIANHFSHIDDYLSYHNNYHPVQPLSQQNIERNMNEVAPALLQEPQMNMFMTSSTEIKESEKNQLNIMICPSTQEKVEDKIPLPVKQSSVQVKSTDTKKKSVPKVAQTTAKPQQDEPPKSDWESVLDDLLKHKTPSRGPKALDVALKRDSFEKHLPQKQKTESSKKKGRGANYDSIKIDSASKKNTTHSQVFQPFTETLNSTKKPNEASSTQKFVKVENSKEEDPFISGIHNSDYDLLDELMDEDLRQEIDDAYRPVDLYTPKEKETLNTTSTFMTTENFIQKEIPPSSISDLRPNIGTNIQNNVIKCNNPKSVILNIPKKASSNATLDSKPRVISNELIVSNTKIDKNIMKKTKPKQNITQKPAIKIDTTALSTNLKINRKESQGNINVSSPIVNIVKKSVKINCTSNIHKSNSEIPTSSGKTVDTTEVLFAPQLIKSSQNLMGLQSNICNKSFIQSNPQDATVRNNAYNCATATPNVFIDNPPCNSKQVGSPVILNNIAGSTLTKPSINFTPTQQISTLDDGRDMKLQTTVNAANNLYKNNVAAESMANTLPNYKSTKNLTTKSGLTKNVKVNDDAKHYSYRGSYLGKSIIQNNDPIRKQTIDEAILNNERKVLSEVQEKLQHAPSEKCEPKNNLIINKKSLFEKDIIYESIETKNNLVINKKKVIENDVKSHDSKEIEFDQVMNKINAFENNPKLQKSVEDKIILADDSKKALEKSGHTKNIITIQKNLIENPLNSREIIDKERIQNKRRSILNKQTIHNYCREPIPLSYYTLNKITPVNKNHKIEKTNLSPEGVGNIANVSYSDQTSKISQSKTCYSENVKHVESSLEEDCVDQILTGPTNIECNLGGNINSIVNETIGEKSVLMPVKQNNMNICEKTQSSSLKSHKSLFKQYDINSSKRDNQKDLGKVIENLYDKIGKKSTQMTEIKNNTTKISETVKTADITDVENEIKNQNPDKVCKMRDENQIPENGNDVMTTVLHKTNRFECINLDDISSSATKGIESNLNSSESCLNTNLEENTISKNNIDNVNTDPLLEKYRDQIYFEEIPREPKDDPLKRIIRIKLPNGSTFKATISGKLDINVDSIFTDPQMKTILLNNTIKNKKCTLNLRQVTVPDKNNSAEKKFVNEILYPKNVNDDAETINLISDDEDKSNKPTKHVFQTEFGDYCVPSIEKEVLLKHQKRFLQKCSVKIERGDILKKIRAAKACLRLESNTICGFQDLPQNMDEEKLFNEGDDNDNIIEIDDSSNDSVNNIKMIKSPERQSNIRPKLSRDLDVLKNSNIKRFLLPNSFETIVDGEPIILEETEFVKIGEFENILRESINDDKNRWMSSCFVKLIRCDNDISINNDNVDEPDDSTSSLHRSGSFSILNDYFIDDLELGDDIINQTEESSEKICQPGLRCYSEWLFTKASLRNMALDNSQFNNCLQCEKIPLDEIQDVSTDYESDLDSYSSLAAEQNKHQCVDQNQLPPSLVSIMTKYFANNPIIDFLKPLAAVNHSVPAINLKRKTVHASADQGITKSKISKTIISMNKPLELQASNDSCIHNIVNIPEAIDGNQQKEEKLQIDIMIDNEKVEKRVRSDDKVTIENKDKIQIPTTKQHKEYVCANQIPSNLKEDKTKFAHTSNDTIFSNDNDCLRMSTSPMDKAREYNNMCTSYFDYTYTVRCVVQEFLKKEKESWDENSLQFNQIKYEGITDIKNSTDDIFDSNSVRRELTESDECSNKLKDVQTKDNLGGLSIDQIKLDGLTTEKEYVADSILGKKETKETYEKPNENIQKIVDDSKNLTIEMPAIIEENSAVFSINGDVSDRTKFNEGNRTFTDENRNSKDLSLYHKTHNNNLEMMLPKSNVSAQKNVTLIYSANSEVILKGSEYKDPKIGTCYLFPLRTYLKKGEENGVLNVLKINTDHSDNGVIEKTIDEDDFHIMIPKLTYSRHRIDTNTSLQYLNSFIKRNLKRKRDSVDTKNNEKRYRKGKNIDYPKFTVAAMEKSAYVKEFNRLIDYWNNVKFSFSRSYHKIENFDVCDLLKSWPIEGTINVSANDCTDENVLFIYDNDEAKFDYDPLHKSFAEELASEYQENEYKSIEINETNFSMGFGEGSDRVIQSYVDRNTLPKISAATLSDVKHAQPSLSFEYCKNLNKTSEDKIEVTQRYISYVRLKDKVRSFFKRTALELHNDWILNNTKECKNCDNIYESSNFPFDVNNLDFFGVPYSESVVQVVQVGQLPVSAAAQNPVTCDPRVTQVTDASPPQCSAENSPRDGSQASMKTEYTELTTADLSIPLVQEYDRHNQTMHMLSQENHKLSFSDENIPIETEVNSIVKIEIAEEVLESEEQNENVENELMNSVTNHDSNRNYSFDTNTVNSMDSQDELSFESLNNCNPYSQHEEQNDSSEKTDQIAHAMNAAGINTNSESLIAEESQTIGNILCDKSSEESRNATQNSHENYSKTTAINALALQQALAQILPPPLNRTNSSENNNQNTNTPSPQVLHIVQGKNSSVNQLTLVDSSQKSVINASNSTPVLHIVQNKGTGGGASSADEPSALPLRSRPRPSLITESSRIACAPSPLESVELFSSKGLLQHLSLSLLKSNGRRPSDLSDTEFDSQNISVFRSGEDRSSSTSAIDSSVATLSSSFVASMRFASNSLGLFCTPPSGVACDMTVVCGAVTSTVAGALDA